MQSQKNKLAYLKEQVERAKRVPIQPPRPKVHEFPGKKESHRPPPETEQQEFSMMDLRATHDPEFTNLNSSGFAVSRPADHFPGPAATLKKQLVDWERSHPGTDGNRLLSREEDDFDFEGGNSLKLPAHPEPVQSPLPLGLESLGVPVDNFKKGSFHDEKSEFEHIDCTDEHLTNEPVCSEVKTENPPDDTLPSLDQMASIKTLDGFEVDRLASNKPPEEEKRPIRELKPPLPPVIECHRESLDPDHPHHEEEYTTPIGHHSNPVFVQANDPSRDIHQGIEFNSADPEQVGSSGFATSPRNKQGVVSAQVAITSPNFACETPQPAPHNTEVTKFSTKGVSGGQTETLTENAFFEELGYLDKILDDSRSAQTRVAELELQVRELTKTLDLERREAEDYQTATEDLLNEIRGELADKDQALNGLREELAMVRESQQKQPEKNEGEEREIQELKSKITELEASLEREKHQRRMVESLTNLRSRVQKEEECEQTGASLAKSVQGIWESIEKGVQGVCAKDADISGAEVNSILEHAQFLDRLEKQLTTSDVVPDQPAHPLPDFELITRALESVSAGIPKIEFDVQFEVPKVTVSAQEPRGSFGTPVQANPSEPKQSSFSRQAGFQPTGERRVPMHSQTEKKPIVGPGALEGQFTIRRPHLVDMSFQLEKGDHFDINYDAKSEFDTGDILGPGSPFLDLNVADDLGGTMPAPGVRRDAPKVNIFKKKSVNVKSVVNGVPDNLF